MAQYGNKGSKNPPWARADQSGMGMSNQMPQNLMNPNLAIPNAALMQYPQQQMFQGQIGYQQQQMYNNMGTVQYPTRALNSAAFQNTSSQSVQSNQSRSNDSSKERVITGTVTKLQDNFGFVDDDIFFQLSCVTNGANNLRIGSRVLVEATFNPTMPFKWNAQRIQVLPTNANQNQQRGDNSDNRFNNRYGNNRNQQQNKNKQVQQNRRPNQMDRARDRSVSVDSDRKRRNLKNPERRRSASRERRTKSRSRSPARKKRRAYVPRYNVQIPKYTLNNFENDMMDIKRKFTDMYIPSDFYMSHSSWLESFPIDKPFNLDVPCKFHVFSKEVAPLKKPIPEPTDVDYLYSAKVILLSSPGLDELYKKCISVADDRERSQSRSPEEDMTIPSKLISLLVGQRGKEPMAIGGPWSPSLDGENPATDPGVLIKTAIRTTKYQTGIDLSNCTHWFRFLEMHYRRSESVLKGKAVDARVETVVLFIPDIWSCVPTRPEWEEIDQAYHSKMLLRHFTNTADDPEEKKEEEEEEEDEKEEEKDKDDTAKKEPTHYSQLDPKNMKVSDLRDELEARGLPSKGLKTQLVAKLAKAIKMESDADEKKETKEKMSDDELDFDEKPAEEEEKQEKEEEKTKEEKAEMDEKEKARLEKLYKLPESPVIIVHPNPEFKAGKFNCTVASLHSLLNYRIEDNKEHSFELFLFAEMFNAMLMRDFSIHIYRALCIAAEKQREKEEKEREEKERKKKEAKEKEEKKAAEKAADKDNKKTEEEEKEKKEKEEKDKKEKEKEKEKEEEEDKEDKESVQSKDKKDEKKKEKVRLKTADPYLLLAFAYFDNTLCGYIMDRDLEDILTNLCLSLSRSQIKKLIQRVVTKDILHYRKLTDKTKEEIEESPQDLIDFKLLTTHANRPLFPKAGQIAKSHQPEQLESGFISYNGSVIDVAKLMTQLERNEASRLNTEKLYNRLLEDHNSLKNNHEKSVTTVKDLSAELANLKKRLSCSNNDLDVMSARVMRYVDVIFQVKKHIDPIIKENTPEEEPKHVVKTEIKHEPVDSSVKKKDAKNDKKEPEKKDGDKPKEPAKKDNKDAEKKDEKEDSQEKKDSDDSDVKIVEETKDKEEEKKKSEGEMEVDETQVTSNGESEADKTEGDANKDEEEEKGKPEPKRKAAVKEDTAPKRTPMKRDVKKENATPSTPKRKRI